MELQSAMWIATVAPCSLMLSCTVLAIPCLLKIEQVTATSGAARKWKRPTVLCCGFHLSNFPDSIERCLKFFCVLMHSKAIFRECSPYKLSETMLGEQQQK